MTLDVETVKTALVVLPPPENMDAYAVEVTTRLNAALAAEAAPLDVCPDCGLTAERIGQMHITAQRLRLPDTETAGENDG